MNKEDSRVDPQMIVVLDGLVLLPRAQDTGEIVGGKRGYRILNPVRSFVAGFGGLKKRQILLKAMGLRFDR